MRRLLFATILALALVVGVSISAQAGEPYTSDYTWCNFYYQPCHVYTYPTMTYFEADRVTVTDKVHAVWGYSSDGTWYGPFQVPDYSYLIQK